MLALLPIEGHTSMVKLRTPGENTTPADLVAAGVRWAGGGLQRGAGADAERGRDVIGEALIGQHKAGVQVRQHGRVTVVAPREGPGPEGPSQRQVPLPLVGHQVGLQALAISAKGLLIQRSLRSY